MTNAQLLDLLLSQSNQNRLKGQVDPVLEQLKNALIHEVLKIKEDE